VDPGVHVEEVSTREVEVERAVVVTQQARDARFEIVVGGNRLRGGDGSTRLRPHAHVARVHGRDEAALIRDSTQTVKPLFDHGLDQDAAADLSRGALECGGAVDDARGRQLERGLDDHRIAELRGRTEELCTRLEDLCRR
jgi:hypothetical protein